MSSERRKFAAMAMQGLLANSHAWEVSDVIIAEAACAIADQLIETLDEDVDAITDVDLFTEFLKDEDKLASKIQWGVDEDDQ